MPYDLQCAMKISEDIATAGLWRAEQWSKIELLSRHCQELDQRLWTRMDETVRGVAGTLRLGLLTTLIRILKWPDWQMPALFTKGFNVIDSIPASNIYPDSSVPMGSLWRAPLSRKLQPMEHEAVQEPGPQGVRRRDLRRGSPTAEEGPTLPFLLKAGNGRPLR